MVKNIAITFAVLISIVLMFFISLSNGIRLGGFDFNNVNIQGLYLKYDKKLIVGTESVTIFNENRTKSSSFRIKFSLEQFFDKYFISVDQFLLIDPFLKVSGNIILDIDDINLENISKVYINNFFIQFHQNLKSVHADKCFVTYKNDNFYFSFENPTYSSIKLDDSKVVIDNYETLKLELRSSDMVNSDLLSLLGNYEINVPVEQIYGENKTVVKLDIPFDIKKDIIAYSDIDVKKGKIKVYDIPLYIQDIAMTLQDNKLSAKGVLLKSSDEHDLQYDLDTEFLIDFSKEIVDGSFDIHKAVYNSIEMEKAKGRYSFDFKDQFSANIDLENNTSILIDDEPFLIKTGKSKYLDNGKSFESLVKLQHSNKPLELQIEDEFNITTNRSKGKVELIYDDIDDIIFSDSLSYTSDFNDSFSINFGVEKLQWYHGESSYIAQKTHGRFQNEKITSRINSIKNLDGDTLIENLDLSYNQKKFLLQNEIFKNQVIATIDTNDGNITGIITQKEKLEKTEFYGNIFNNPYIKVNNWDAELKTLNKHHFITTISKPAFLKSYFDYLEFDSFSNIHFDKKRGVTPTVYTKNIDFDLYKFLNETKANGEGKFKLNLFWENSSIKYNKYTLPFKKANIILDDTENKAFITTKENELITIQNNLNAFVVKSYNLSSNYINTIFQKKLLDGGNVEFFLTSSNIDTFEGIVKLNNTTIKDLQLVDNLLLFVNSAPAIINPVLAIPTLFRFGKNKFKLDGYHIVKGEFKFIYHRASNILEIKDLQTNGNINNFSGNVEINLNNDQLNGNISVCILKDFASVIEHIPVMNKLILNTENEISIPITLGGTLEDTKFEILNSTNKN